MNLKLNLSNDDLLTSWRCIKKVLDKDIPENSSDIGLLMETMGDLAKQFENLKSAQHLEEDFKESIEFFISKDKAVAMWHCFNIVLENSLHPDPLEHPGELGKISDAMETLAHAIDDHSHRKSNITLVQ
jgi:hypothetical protein